MSNALNPQLTEIWMNAPSRNMPPSEVSTKPTLATWLVLAGFAAFLVWGVVVEPTPVRWIGAGSIALVAALSILHRLRLRRIRNERKEESICTFSRALPAKSHDTWVVRAVYEEITKEAEGPIRPSDDIAKFWGIVSDDLDDVVLRIAHRAGRSLEDAQKNPMFDKVVTVADLISFLEAQPILNAPRVRHGHGLQA